MNALTPQTPASEESLSQLIEQHISSANELLEILKQERQALVSGKVEALEQVSGIKLQCVNGFKLIGDKLNRLLGSETIDAVLSRIGASHLQQRWQQLLALARECQQDNLANGAIIVERQGYVRDAIKNLFGQEARPSVYGRMGDTSFSPERRIIASA